MISVVIPISKQVVFRTLMVVLSSAFDRIVFGYNRFRVQQKNRNVGKEKFIEDLQEGLEKGAHKTNKSTFSSVLNDG